MLVGVVDVEDDLPFWLVEGSGEDVAGCEEEESEEYDHDLVEFHTEPGRGESDLYPDIVMTRSD